MPMSLKADLADIVGSAGVSDDEQTLARYASDQSFVSPSRPDYLVFPKTVDEIQALVRMANRTRTPLIPLSSGLNLHGAAIPSRGGVVVNLSSLNRILMVDEDNWFAVVEPGVTYEQLQNELGTKNLRIMIPLGVPPQRTALSSILERDPALAAASFEYGNDLMLDTEIILPGGDLFRTGLWASGGRPGSHLGPVRGLLYRFWTAAQGTLGILTKLALQIEHLPGSQEIFFLTFNTLAEGLEAIKHIQRKEIGLECFLLNRFNLAGLFCRDWKIPSSYPTPRVPSSHFDSLLHSLPPFVLTICLPDAPRMPEEKRAYEREALRNVCTGLGCPLLRDIEPLTEAGPVFSDLMLRPWGILRKFCFKGSVHDLSFKSPPRRVPEFEATVNRICTEHGYPLSDIGIYLLPLERARAVHLEFDLHCDPADPREAEQARKLWLNLSEALIAQGALFDRPYGAWADMIYKHTGNYAAKLKELKKELDPNNIMNPGKLCFA